MAAVRAARRSKDRGTQTGYGSGRSLTRPPLIRWGHAGDRVGMRQLTPRLGWSLSQCVPCARGKGGRESGSSHNFKEFVPGNADCGCLGESVPAADHGKPSLFLALIMRLMVRRRLEADFGGLGGLQLSVVSGVADENACVAPSHPLIRA